MSGSPASAATSPLSPVADTGGRRCCSPRQRRPRAPLRPRPGSGFTAWSRPSSSSAWSPLRDAAASSPSSASRPKGTTVKKGDLVIEFDRQQPLRNAIDKRAEWKDLEEEIQEAGGDHPADAVDETALKTAENALALAKLETSRTRAAAHRGREEHAQPRGRRGEAAQPSQAFALKHKAAAAELAILEVRRDRAARVRHARWRPPRRCSSVAPIDGLVVPRTIWKGGGGGEPQEGDEVWPGSQVLDLVGPSAMRVRVRVNQADLHGLGWALPARVTLDAYPDAAIRRACCRSRRSPCAARSRRRSARSPRCSPSTRRSRSSRPICRPPSTCCRRRALVPLGSPARRPMRLWGIGAVVALLGGGGWFALGRAASAAAGTSRRRRSCAASSSTCCRSAARSAPAARCRSPRRGRRRAADRVPGAERRRGQDRRGRDQVRHDDGRTQAGREALGAAPGRGRDRARARRQRDQRAGTRTDKSKATTTSSARSSMSAPAKWSHDSRASRR